MKRRAIFTLFFICFFLFSFAWERHSDTTFLVSLKGGITNTSPIGLEIETETFWGFNSGLMFTLHLQQEISLHTGLGYLQKGFNTEMPYQNWLGDDIGMHPTEDRFNYWNIPITAQYNLGRRKFNIYITGGLDINILHKKIRSADLPEVVDDVKIDPYEENLTERYKRTSLGYHFGVGAEYKFYPALSIFLDYKSHNDIGNIYSDNVKGNLKLKYYTINFGVKIGIPIKYDVYYVADGWGQRE